MKLVADTNRIIAALLRDSVSRKIFYSSKFSLSSVAFARVELKKYESFLLDKTDMKESVFLRFMENLFRRIEWYDEAKISKTNAVRAEVLLREKDEKDIPFLALALELECGIWTEDRDFQVQRQSKVWSTDELKQML